MKIGFYDSGVGGLSILLPFIKKYNRIEYIYLGDNKYFPYGEKDYDWLRQRAKEVAGFFNEKEADFLMVACNTVSASSLDILKEDFKGEVFGIIDCGVLGAVRATKNEKIGLMATTRTIQEGIYQKMILESGEYKIVEKATPEIIDWIEKREESKSKLREQIQKDLEIFKKSEVDTLILACTHFPLIEDELQRALPEVTFIDPADCLLEKMSEIVVDEGKGQLEIYYTEEEGQFIETIEKKILRQKTLEEVVIR